MSFKTILIISLSILISFVLIACYSIPYYSRTYEFCSNILYRNGIEIYKIFTRKHFLLDESILNEFDVIEGEFYVESEYYNRVIYNKYPIIILQSKEELQDMNDKITCFSEIEQNIDDYIFESNILGMVVVPFSGSNFLKNAKIYNKENDIAFSIDIWYRTTPIGAGPVASAWMALFFLKIPK